MSESKVKTTHLIAGATRGIGLALVADVASKDHSGIIYAGARNPFSPGSSQLKELAAKYPGRIEIVKYIAGDKEGNDAVAKLIGEKHGHIDTVIANAGINVLGAIHEVPIHQFEDVFAVNVIGPIVLFQSVRKLLKASPLPRFIPISSVVGSIELIPTMPVDGGPYATSKAALNWVTRKIHYENEWLISFPICPGPVETDMARKAVGFYRNGDPKALDGVWRPANIAASLVVDVITASTRKKDGGVFNNVEGGKYPW